MTPVSPRRLKAAFYLALTLGLPLLPGGLARAQAPGPQGPGLPPGQTGAPGAPGPGFLNPASPTPTPGPLTSPPQPGVAPVLPPSPGPLIAPQAPPGAASPEPAPPGSGRRVRVRADSLSSNRQTGVTTFRGNVRVDYNNSVIEAEELSIDQNAQEVFTDTRFTFTQPDPQRPGSPRVVTGTGLRYRYDVEEGTVFNANLTAPAEYPGETVYIRAKTLQIQGQQRFEATDAVFTTCEDILGERVPHYHAEIKHLQYFAGDKIVAWDNRTYINGRYVFWLPVFVYPLRGERNPLDVGRTQVEGFYLRTGYTYSLPALNNGYWLNDGRLILNLFEKKGPAMGFEHTARWGYDATSYAFFYGLLTPDRTNFLPGGTPGGRSAEENEALVRQGRALFGLPGTPFQDHQLGLDHRQRLFGDLELGGRFEDHNIYDPLSENVRISRQIRRFELKDQAASLGNLTYNLSLDSTLQGGTQVPTTLGTAQLPQNTSNRLQGNMGFNALATDVRLSTNVDRNQQSTRRLTTRGLQQAGAEFDVQTIEGAISTQVSNNYNANTTFGPDTRSAVTIPHRINFREEAPPQPGATPGAVTSPQPLEQQMEPQVDFSHRLAGIGTLGVQAQKFLNLTQPPAGQTRAQEIAAITQANRIDRLPEVTLTSEQFLTDYQPFNLKLGYGRFFEYASFRDPGGDVPINRFFPGSYINRLNPELSVASRGLPLGFNTQLDFGGSGYRQFFYSTGDAQYSVDERARLSTSWTEKIQTNFNYTNTRTPEGPTGPGTFTNNSPFQLDRIALSRQTQLTGSLDVRNDPFFTYALRSGYDYQNRLYQNISSEVTWRNRLFGLPFGLTLNTQFDPADTPYLDLRPSTLNLPYLPPVPLYGIQGRWIQTAGTFTLRSTPDVFGGVYGSDRIVPGWQLDNAVAYDFERGEFQSLINRLYWTIGNTWQTHTQLVLGGYYDIQAKEYRFSEIGINKDLHDFVLTLRYDRLASFYSVGLTMTAFPSGGLNFTSNTFNRRGGAGGAAFPGSPI